MKTERSIMIFPTSHIPPGGPSLCNRSRDPFGLQHPSFQTRLKAKNRIGDFKQHLALNLQTCWEAAKASPSGRFAVIDVFSGCGGMSSGFKSVNGVRPTFRIAGAIDIDEIANETYEKNLGIRPLKLDV